MGGAIPVKGSSPAPSGLADRQAQLVAALVAGGPVPAGFDACRLAVARRALLRKRAGETAAVWPLMAASLGCDWPRAFAAHAEGRPPAGALRDGWDLARALHARGALGDLAAVELAEREVALRYDGHSAPRPRRGPSVRRVGTLVVLRLAGRNLRFGAG
jgi:hypothetical protein